MQNSFIFMIMVLIFLEARVSGAFQEQDLTDSFHSYVASAQLIGDRFKNTFDSPPTCVSLTLEGVKNFLSNVQAGVKEGLDNLFTHGSIASLRDQVNKLQESGDAVRGRLSKWEWYNRLHHFFWANGHPECQNISDQLSSINGSLNNLFIAGANIIAAANCIQVTDESMAQLIAIEGNLKKAMDSNLKKTISLEATFKKCASEEKP